MNPWEKADAAAREKAAARTAVYVAAKPTEREAMQREMRRRLWMSLFLRYLRENIDDAIVGIPAVAMARDRCAADPQREKRQFVLHLLELGVPTRALADFLEVPPLARRRR